jgi:Fic family protein
LGVLFSRPIVSMRQVEVALQIPYKSAQRYIEKLVELGLLQEITGKARNWLYCADEILHAIDAPLEE